MNEMASKTKPNKTIKTDYSSVIKKLQLKEENSTCFDCGCKGTTYFVLNFATFVCSKCAGILRELRFKVKGISVSLFNEEEKNHAEMMGNENATKVWMRLFNYKSYSIPKNQNEFKNHLKDKYIHKKYFKRNKNIKKVRFDSEESDSDSNSDNLNDDNDNDDDGNKDESNEDEESEDEEDEEEENEEDGVKDNDKAKESPKEKETKAKKANKSKEEKGIKKENENENKRTPITLMRLKKPHNKITSESMKYSKKTWKDLWDKADLTKIKQVSINDFEFFDKDSDSNKITNTNTNKSSINSSNTQNMMFLSNEVTNTQNATDFYQINAFNTNL